GGIAVEVLVNVVAAVVPTAAGLGTHRPGILHPAAFIDVVNQEIAIRATASPQEGVKAANLVKQLAEIGVAVGLGKGRRGRPGHAISAQESDVAHLAVLDTVE